MCKLYSNVNQLCILKLCGIGEARIWREVAIVFFCDLLCSDILI